VRPGIEHGQRLIDRMIRIVGIDYLGQADLVLVVDEVAAVGTDWWIITYGRGSDQTADAVSQDVHTISDFDAAATPSADGANYSPVSCGL
jgi:hypothetical protein